MSLTDFLDYINSKAITKDILKDLFSVTGHNKKTLTIRAMDKIVANRELLHMLRAYEAGEMDAVEASIARANSYALGLQHHRLTNPAHVVVWIYQSW